MEFWGAEVKPGEPYTLSARTNSMRILRVSTATLSTVPGTQPNDIVLLKCNIGSKSPIFLCGLSSRTLPSFSLNAEFNEEEDIEFSVVGPCGVYLLGHYVCARRDGNESEPSGEDIATESDKENSVDNEDSYEDSFIDDDEPILFDSDESEDAKNNSKKRKSNSKKCQIIDESQELTSNPLKKKKKYSSASNSATSNSLKDYQDPEMEKEMTGILEYDKSNGRRETCNSEARKKNKKITGSSKYDKGNGEKETDDLQGKTVIEAYPDGLEVKSLTGKGEGKEAVEGKKVKVKYHGRIKESGELFEDVSSKKIRLGKGSLVKGLEKGVEGMRVGDKRIITLPPSLGYGELGNGHSVPPNSWLIYEVELLKVI